MAKHQVIQGVKFLIFILACYFIYKKLILNEDVDLKQCLDSALKLRNAGFIVVLVILMVINWSIEAVKWKYLVSKFQRISFKESFYGILKGVYFSLITPNRIGDGIGKIDVVKSKRKPRAAYSFIVGSISQSLALTIGGVLALWLCSKRLLPDQSMWLILRIGLSALFIFLSITYYVESWRLQAAKLISKITKRESEVQYTSHDLNNVLAMSLFRYVIFSLQFFICLLIFDLKMDWMTAFICIGIMYLLTTWIPSFFMGDLGVRESVALLVFGQFSPFPEKALFASLLLWMINLLVPAIIGMFTFSFKKKKIV